MRARAAVLFAALFLLGGLLAAGAVLRHPQEGVDAVAVNRILRGAERDWGEWERLPPVPYAFSALDQSGRVVFRSSDDAPDSLSEALRGGGLAFDVPQGRVLIATGLVNAVRQRERRLALLVLALFCAGAALSAWYFWYLRRRVFLPFWELREFAARVASGNLEAPLRMDRANLFGAFTESFDLMRDALREARARAVQAEQEKKELVASLSHDIRTPVTAIKLQCELLALTAPGPLAPKLQTIRDKAECIDSLITNLFQSTLEELGELRVNPEELDSRAIGAMLRSADFEGKLLPYDIPGCILRADPLRLEQILDNILSNTCKYAGTPVRAIFSLADEFLVARFEDSGGGVDPEDLPHLTQKFYRGRNAAGRDGAGLGLYLCRHLIGQMGGDLRCGNTESGFFAELLLPLA